MYSAEMLAGALLVDSGAAAVAVVGETAMAGSVGIAASPAAIMELFRKSRRDRGKGFLSQPVVFLWMSPKRGW